MVTMVGGMVGVMITTLVSPTTKLKNYGYGRVNPLIMVITPLINAWGNGWAALVINMGVSMNEGIQKWMVYNGKIP